jgi:carboxyl-terminal processing protease
VLPACNKGSGANICAPDVCKTPPPPVVGRPVPYTNRSAHAIAVPFSPTTFLCMLPALHLMSKIPVTTGDEPGIFGPGPKRVGAFIEGNPNVFVDMIPAVNLTCAATGNAANATGAALVPDAVNVFYNLAGGLVDGREPAPLAAEEIAALRAPLDEAGAPSATMLKEGVALVRVAAFTADLPTRLHNAILALEAEGMTALVLDLRGNPGGDLDACLRLLGGFLPSGTILGRTVDADGDETIHRGRCDDPYAMPLGVLVDRGTASAAELFAGSLKAHGRALVAGERTYGKGSAQALLPGRDAPGAFYATVATVLLPDGEPIEGRGVLPDVDSGGRERALDTDLSA